MSSGGMKFSPPTRGGRGGGGGSGGGWAAAAPYRRSPRQPREVPLDQLLEDVLDPLKRGPALTHLSTKRQTEPDFSLKVWHSPVIVTLILQEILRIYPYIGLQEQMPDDDCNRVSCAISLFHPLARDDRVRSEFLRAEIPQYLYPFLATPRQSASFEKLRLASLGIIGSLVKEVDNEAIEYLLRSEVVPLCLRCMEVGSDFSKTTATLILEKIISTEIGLNYTWATQDRFFAINQMLASMCTFPRETPSPELLRRIVSCFSIFSCNKSVSQILYNLLPGVFKDGSYFHMFQGDRETLEGINQLLWNLKDPHYQLFVVEGGPQLYYGDQYQYYGNQYQFG